MSTIGRRIKSERIKLGYNQKELCDRAGITPATLSRYEKDTRQPKSSNLSRLARALNVTTDYLTSGIKSDKRSVEVSPSVSDSYACSLQCKITEVIKYGYIKQIVRELKNTYGEDIYELASKNLIQINTLSSDIEYNFDAIYNSVGEMHYIFLTPGLCKYYKKVAVAHIIGYSVLINGSDYKLIDIGNRNSSDIENRCNIFAAEYLIDDESFIEKLSIGDDVEIAKSLKVPVSFIKHKKTLIRK